MTARSRAMAASVVALLLGFSTAPAGAQEAGSLARVEELTRQGRTEEARIHLLEWWDEALPDASRRDRQLGLWLRARLTVDPVQASLDFRRLVVEYPGGPYSGDALLRLAQVDWAVGNAEGVRDHLAQLERNYPKSPVLREARAWRSGAGPLPSPPASPPEGRGGETATGADGAAAAPGGGSQLSDGRYAVQVGAFAGEGRARALRDRVQGAGYRVRMVRVEGSELTHVRVGRFPSLQEAEKLWEEIRALGLAAAVVRDADRERREPR